MRVLQSVLSLFPSIFGDFQSIIIAFLCIAAPSPSFCDSPTIFSFAKHKSAKRDSYKTALSLVKQQQNQPITEQETEEKNDNDEKADASDPEVQATLEKISSPTPKSEYFSQHDLCEYEIMKAEKKYGIPRKLLMAIGTVESGRSTNGSGKRRPYPWTICANGKGYFLSTKNAAIATVKKLMARGIRNIDVGCMQVNLLHHSKAFKTLEEAFTPKNNVAYASKYFMQLKNSYKSWTNAVGYYHSRAAKHYKPYCSMVYNEWKKVANQPVNTSVRVRKASSKVPSKISYIPAYYSLADKKFSAKLHKLGRMSISRTPPKFFAKQMGSGA